MPLALFSLMLCSCSKDESDSEQEVITLSQLSGKWESGGDFLVLCPDNTFKAYMGDDMLEIGHFAYDQDAGTVKCVNGYNQNTTTILINAIDETKMSCDVIYTSTLTGTQNSKSLNLKKNGDQVTAFDFPYAGFNVEICSEAHPNILGPGEILTTSYVNYFLIFENNYVGTYLREQHYASRPTQYKRKSFDYYYVYNNNKLYTVQYTEDPEEIEYDSFYHNCNSGKIVICDFVINNDGKVEKWDDNQM